MNRHLLALALAGVLATSAHAVLNFNLTVNSGTVPSTGGTVTLVGSLTGLTTDAALADVTFTTPAGTTLTLDPAFVAYLGGNTLGDYSTGNIAEIVVPSGYTAGAYAGQVAVSDSSIPGFTDSEAYVVQVQAVPEPAAFASLGVGLIALARRRKSV